MATANIWCHIRDQILSLKEHLSVIKMFYMASGIKDQCPGVIFLPFCLSCLVITVRLHGQSIIKTVSGQT